MNTQVGEKIHDLRTHLGLSLRTFGGAIGYSGMHISRFEQNTVQGVRHQKEIIKRINYK